jgi:type I restriction enzyme M protein
LEKSKPWKKWLETGVMCTPLNVFGSLHRKAWDSEEDAFRDINVEGQVNWAPPPEVSKELAKLGAQSDPDGALVTDLKGRTQPDIDLRDHENASLPLVPVVWREDVTPRLVLPEYRAAVDEFLLAEVHPYHPDAWLDYDKTKIGYEVPLTRYFYRYVPPRPLLVIDEEIKQLEAKIQSLLKEVASQ